MRGKKLKKERDAIDKGSREFLEVTKELKDVGNFFENIQKKADDKAEDIKKESEKTKDTKDKSDPFKKELKGGDIIDELLNFTETY